MFDQDLVNAPKSDAGTLKKIKELVDKCFLLKAEADAAEKKFKAAKNELSDIMTNAEVDKITGDNCSASLALKTSVSCPKEDAKKIELFTYLAEKDCNEENKKPKWLAKILIESPTLLNMLTINASTFSSWHDKEIASKVAEGEIDFKLPMVEPYSYYSVGFRKRNKK